MPLSTRLPRCSGAARWQQRSSSAAALPALSRNSTTGSLQMRRASGAAPSSSAQAAMYQALRTNIRGLLGERATDDSGETKGGKGVRHAETGELRLIHRSAMSAI